MHPAYLWDTYELLPSTCEFLSVMALISQGSIPHQGVRTADRKDAKKNSGEWTVVHPQSTDFS